MLQSLLQDNRKDTQRERFYFLPGALLLPDLIVDFQQLVTLPRDKLSTMDRLASLDSPFAEAMLSRFAGYIGRLGKPDLDSEAVLQRLYSEARQQE